MVLVLLQLSGQGPVTFYTVTIFSVRLDQSVTRTSHVSPQDTCSSIPPPDSALLVGVTYLASALLSLILKNLVGRRVLLLVSMLGMTGERAVSCTVPLTVCIAVAVSQMSLGTYFVHLDSISQNCRLKPEHSGHNLTPAGLISLPLSRSQHHSLSA